MDESVTTAEFERILAQCHESVRRIAAYWRGKAGERRMPSRGDIDPADLVKHLPAIMLVDVVPDARRFVYRLVGTQEAAGRGKDPTGLAVADAFYAQSAAAALEPYEYVVREKRPCCVRDPYRTPDGWLEREDTIYLPLSDDDETVNMILVFSYTYDFRSRWDY